MYVTYRTQFDGYVVAAFYDEELAYDYAQNEGKGTLLSVLSVLKRFDKKCRY